MSVDFSFYIRNKSDRVGNLLTHIKIYFRRAVCGIKAAHDGDRSLFTLAPTVAISSWGATLPTTCFRPRHVRTRLRHKPRQRILKARQMDRVGTEGAWGFNEKGEAVESVCKF
jgi:hypothetical protein